MIRILLYKTDILKKVYVDKIEHKARAILIDLEKARNWYFGDNATLKALALSVYNESELCNSYEYISKQVDVNFITLRVPFENNMFLQLYLNFLLQLIIIIMVGRKQNLIQVTLQVNLQQV